MAYVGSTPAELFGTLNPNSVKTIDIQDDAVTAAKIAAGAVAYADVTGTPTLATVATTGAYSDVTGTPTLATVATTGAYADVTGTPTLPTFPSGDVVGTTDTQTLTNKTLVDPVLTLSASQGTAGQVPVSQGTGLAPVWGSGGISTAKVYFFAGF